MKTKEAWIEEVLNSLDGIRCAPADPDLLRKLQVKTGHARNNTLLIKRYHYYSVAAGMALLITLNIFTLLHYHQTQATSQQVPSAVATEYLSYLKPIKL